VQSVSVIAVAGEIDLDNQQELELAVRAQLLTHSVVLDCSELEFLSISALRSLEACAAVAHAAGHQFHLSRPPPHVSRLLDLAGLGHLERDGTGG